MIDINNIYILNPDYHFKNDIDRIVMYSNKQVKYNASIEWIGYIHPFQAMILWGSRNLVGILVSYSRPKFRPLPHGNKSTGGVGSYRASL